MTQMTISKSARQAGVGVETVRFYERHGLIQQPRKPDGIGFRVYPEAPRPSRSAAVALPLLIRKLQCCSETCAPPRVRPRQPA